MLPTRKSLLTALFTLAVSVPACAPHDGGQVGEENSICQAVQSEELLPDDPTPLGFSVSDILSIVEGSRQTPLRWADGTSTTLHIEISFATIAYYHDREWVDGSASRAEPASADCEDILSLQIRVRLQSDDGALDEDFFTDIEATEATEALIVTGLNPPVGSLSVESFAPPGTFDSYSLYLDLALQAQELRGRISGQAARTEQAGGDGSTSATYYEIASFGTLIDD